MAEKKRLTPDEIAKYFKDEFKTNIKDIKIKEKVAGAQKNKAHSIWIKVENSVFKKVVNHLISLKYPHLAVTSGNDLGKIIELIYHFTIYYEDRMGEIAINISVELPKSKPEIDSICDLIPGALVTEREKIEFLGVKFKGIPDDRRLFLPEDIPKDIYPWRRDETGPDKLYKNLHEGKK